MTKKATSITKKKSGKIPSISLSKLKKQADKVFSNFIRERDCFVCYTCGKKGSKSDIDCGHYISRTYLGTRYDEKNCHAQCKGCNIFRHGNLTIYATRLEKQFGHGILQELEEKATKGLQTPTRAFLIEVISYYTLKKIGQVSNDSKMDKNHGRYF